MTPQETVSTTPLVSSHRAKSENKQMDAVLQNAWARAFVPSLSDLFFVAIMCWLFMGGAGWSALLADADVGWHIRTGQYILNHHAVPYHDLYSFSKPGAPWFAWEWLSDILDATLFGIAGLKGVVLVAGVTIALFATTLIRRVTRLGVNLFASLLIALLGVGGASVHFLARPHVFTLLLISVCMWLLETDRDGAAPKNRLFLLIPVVMVWTNLHGGFLVMIAILGVSAVGSLIESFLAAKASGVDPKQPSDFLKQMNWSNPLRYGILTVGCAAASLVNPYGWGLHKHILEYLRSDWIRNVVQEFQSPSFRSENMMQFELLMFAGLIATGSLMKRHRVVEGLWILMCSYLALSSARHVPVFVAVTLPLIAGEVAGWWQAFTNGATKQSLVGILNSMADECMAGFRRSSVWPAVFVLALVFTGKPIKWPTDFPKEMFPIDMVHAHEAELLQSRLLTTDQWADYLIFLHPDRQRVFVDGRSDFYGPEVGNQYIHVLNGNWDWYQVMKQYQFNLALVPTDQAIAQLLKKSPEWRVVQDDGKHILLARRPENIAQAAQAGAPHD
jgi:hypothetical protein